MDNAAASSNLNFPVPLYPIMLSYRGRSRRYWDVMSPWKRTPSKSRLNKEGMMRSVTEVRKCIKGNLNSKQQGLSRN